MTSQTAIVFGAADLTGLIVPLIFFGIFILKFFLKRKDTDNSATENAGENRQDSNERVQKIREEIARRMAEKKQKIAPEPEQFEPEPQRRFARVQSTQRVPEPPPIPRESDIDRQTALMSELEKAKKRVQASQQRVETLLRQSSAKKTAYSIPEISPAGTGKTSVLSFLKNKDSLRAAIVVREILSPPLSLRKD